MEWSHPFLPLLLFAPLAGFLWWSARRSLHPMGAARRRALLWVRSTLVLLALLALAAPALHRTTRDETVIFVLDHSRSQGLKGIAAAEARFSALAAGLAPSTLVGAVSAGATAIVRRLPGADRTPLAADPRLAGADSSDTDLESAVALAAGLFPPSSARRLVLLTDGVETRGDLLQAAREAAILGVKIDALALRGEARPDVRLESLRPSRARLHEGAQLSLSAHLQSSLSGRGRIRLYENGIEVDSRPLEVAAGEEQTVEFTRTPDRSQLYSYRALVDGFTGDVAPENDESLALVDVRGRPVILHVDSDPREAAYLAEAMAREGIELSHRPPESIPATLEELAGYDGVVLSDVPAHRIGEKTMAVLRDYVEHLGGGFLMVGGPNSFGAGGYYRTAIEDVLPVKMKAPDQEEKAAVALALVIDRSGSMEGVKIEICKSATIATVQLLSKKDYVGVVAFDSQATWVVPMERLSSAAAVASRVSTINAGGGTNIYPGMSAARDALLAVKTKVKHMIVLTDGQTGGAGYAELAARLRAEGVTVSTVGIGDGADVGLLQAIAAAGGGKHYFTLDPRAIPQIFTQDAMSHLGKLIREEEFQPRQVERHPMVEGIDLAKAPPLLGYVKTHRKATAQMPLVTDLGDPLLAHWRFGVGKVTAFTSDAKSRWSALWLSSWSGGYSQFWAQVLREMAREPQGRLIDLHLRRSGRDAVMEVDLLEDAANWKNGANVDAEAYFVPAHALGSSLRPFSKVALEQTGPGRYGGRFTPREPGVYLVRARSEAETVTAGIVENLSGESVIGQVNATLLEKACALTGGRLLPADAQSLPPLERPGRTRSIELAPFLVLALLVLFLADLVIRRWENVLGFFSALRVLRSSG